MSDSIYPNMFKGRYPRGTFKGQDWLKNVSPEDRKAFSERGRFHADRAIQERLGEGKTLAHLGGLARAGRAHRDGFKRFYSVYTQTTVFTAMDIYSEHGILLEGKGEPQAVHTYECIYRQGRASLDRAEFLTRWPNAHQACDARGAYGSDQICSRCLGHGFCPRCGEVAWLLQDFEDAGPDGVTCPFCDWNQGTAIRGLQGHAMPPMPECYCLDEAIDKLVFESGYMSQWKEDSHNEDAGNSDGHHGA